MIGFLASGRKGGGAIVAASRASFSNRHKTLILSLLVRNHPVHPFRVFTLEQANSAVPRVARVTAEVQQRLDELRRSYQQATADTESSLEEETRALLGSWQDAILAIGAEPKGLFTVDFRSPDPNVLWCWTVSEPEITHRHFTWESFKNRVDIRDGGSGWLGSN